MFFFFPQNLLSFTDNHIYFRSGEKSFYITKTSFSREFWYDWVERPRLHIRRMYLSREAIFWVSWRFREASSLKGRVYNTWKCRDKATSLVCSMKFNKFGRYISTIVVTGESKVVIIMPENTFNEGWSTVAFKMESFVNRGSSRKH